MFACSVDGKTFVCCAVHRLPLSPAPHTKHTHTHNRKGSRHHTTSARPLKNLMVAAALRDGCDAAAATLFDNCSNGCRRRRKRRRRTQFPSSNPTTIIERSIRRAAYGAGSVSSSILIYIACAVACLRRWHGNGSLLRNAALRGIMEMPQRFAAAVSALACLAGRVRRTNTARRYWNLLIYFTSMRLAAINSRCFEYLYGVCARRAARHQTMHETDATSMAVVFTVTVHARIPEGRHKHKTVFNAKRTTNRIRSS